MSDYPMDPEGHGEDTLEPLEVSEVPTRKKPQPALSDSLRAAVSQPSPIILGPALFDEAAKAYLKRHENRKEADRTGLLFVEVDGRMRFLYRDPEALAWHLFQDLNGLCFPCVKSDAEKRSLKEGFRRGWESGELAFLASVKTEELEDYRQRLTGVSEAQPDM